MKNIAIIPARGGSKRIPRKNIKLFFGKPIIAWSIQEAIKSSLFDRIIVSTDDSEIAKISEKLGAEIPFIRPPSIADDNSSTAEVIIHAINWLTNNSFEIENICCIYPTAPFLESNDLKLGFEKLNGNNIDFSFSATSFEYPIQRAFKLNINGTVQMFDESAYEKKSQDLVEAFHDAGQFYWGKKDAWLENRPIFNNRSLPVLIPKYRAQDIDTPNDWLRAEKLFSLLKS